MEANKITSIKAIKGYYVLTLNCKQYPIDTFFYEDLLPYVGKVLQVKDMLDLIAFSSACKYLKNIYKSIYNHSISAYDLKLKLKNKSIDEQHIKLIINKFKEMGYLSEDDFINYYKAIYEEKKGKNAFKKFLESKYINKDKIDKALSNFNENIEIAFLVAKNFLKNKIGSNALLKQKTYACLINKGFSKETINEVISMLSFENEDDSLKIEVKKMKRKYQDDNKIIYRLASKGYSINKIKYYLNKEDDIYEN